MWREYLKGQGISGREPFEPEIGWGMQRVYFLHFPTQGEVKIGFTANWEQRQAAIGYESGTASLLLGFLNGGRDLERIMLQRFHPWLRRGREWFSDEIVPEAEWLIQMDRDFYGPESRERSALRG